MDDEGDEFPFKSVPFPPPLDYDSIAGGTGGAGGTLDMSNLENAFSALTSRIERLERERVRKTKVLTHLVLK